MKSTTQRFSLRPKNRLYLLNVTKPLQPHYRTFVTTTRRSVPLRRIGTFGLAVLAACAFSLGIAGKVLTFHTKVWPGFAPPTRRMPSGPPGLIPEEGSPPGFDIT